MLIFFPPIHECVCVRDVFPHLCLHCFLCVGGLLLFFTFVDRISQLSELAQWLASLSERLDVSSSGIKNVGYQLSFSLFFHFYPLVLRL